VTSIARCNSAPSAVVTALKAARAAKLAESSKKRKAEEDVEQRRLERSASLGAAGAAAGGQAKPWLQQQSGQHSVSWDIRRAGEFKALASLW
jgi:hypothetical protein